MDRAPPMDWCTIQCVIGSAAKEDDGVRVKGYALGEKGDDHVCVLATSSTDSPPPPPLFSPSLQVSPSRASILRLFQHHPALDSPRTYSRWRNP
jgi:hypothetical protein